MSDTPDCSHFLLQKEEKTSNEGFVRSSQFLLDRFATHLQQSQQLNAIRTLIDPCSSEGCLQHQTDSSKMVQEQLQESEATAVSEQRSKKDILKEKRDRKKLRIQEIKMSYEENSTQFEKKDLTKEERAERQRIKNRESAQLSRDRKKHKENLMQNDLQFLTEENKHLQALLKQSYRCTSCGFQNNHDSKETTKDCNQAPMIEYNYNTNIATDYHQTNDISNSYQEKLQSSTLNATTSQNSVYQFFDFSKQGTLSAFLASQSANQNQGNCQSIGKGTTWSATFLIFLLYMMILFPSPHQQQQENWGVIEESLRQFQALGMNVQTLEEYRDMTQEQLLERLLVNLENLEASERDGFIQSIASSSQENKKDLDTPQRIKQVEGIATFNPSERVSQFLKEYSAHEKKVEKDENDYYSDIKKKLEELHQEKLSQIQSLKNVLNIGQLPESPSLSLEETRSHQPSIEQEYSPDQEFHKHSIESASMITEKNQIYQNTKYFKNQYESFHAENSNMEDSDEDYESMRKNDLSLHQLARDPFFSYQDQPKINYYEYFKNKQHQAMNYC